MSIQRQKCTCEYCIFSPKKWPVWTLQSASNSSFIEKVPFQGPFARLQRIHKKKLSNDLGSIHLEVTSYGLRKTGLNSLEEKRRRSRLMLFTFVNGPLSKVPFQLQYQCVWTQWANSFKNHGVHQFQQKKNLKGHLTLNDP